MNTMKIAALLAAAVPLGALVLTPSPAAAIPVFDASNYAQNLLQAARALEQINHQVRSLQNEAAMIEAMSRNLERVDFPELQRVQRAMQRIDGLMEQARAIDFQVEGLDRRIEALFPGAGAQAMNRNARVVQARERLAAAQAGYVDAMRLQAHVAENVREDAALLADLARRSDGAVGALQAQQAASQLAALGVKQQLQLQSLLASEFRSAGIERARRAQAEAEGREATRRFLGRRQAYAPRGD